MSTTTITIRVTEKPWEEETEFLIAILFVTMRETENSSTDDAEEDEVVVNINQKSLAKLYCYEAAYSNSGSNNVTVDRQLGKVKIG